jgi:tetratricopeptide (TPR) repeat protein
MLFNPRSLADYNTAIALNPQNAEAYHNRGDLKSQKLNKFSEALADFDRAIAINPQLAATYANRGLLKYKKLNKRPSGITDMRQAAKLAKAQGNTQLFQLATGVLKSWGIEER